LLRENERDPMKTSSLGTGLLIKHAIQRHNVSKIILGLGGTATNDGGMGILEALGYTFLNSDGLPLKSNGGSLKQVSKIFSPTASYNVEIQLAVDVTNPLCGPNGAAAIYAPQKGASADEVSELDNGLKNFARVLESTFGKQLLEINGMGAAGGMPASMVACFNASLNSGAELVLDASNIHDDIAVADLVITGEGRMDDQTMQGKLVSIIRALALKYNKRYAAICGSSTSSARELFDAVVSIREYATSDKESIEKAAELIEAECRRLVFPSNLPAGRQGR
jgi:glycerate 2-kinase